MDKLFKIITSFFIFLAIYVYSQFFIKTSHYEINGPEDWTIVVVSDLHNNLFGENQKYLIKKIEEENPDCIFLVGDMARDNFDNFETLLKNMNQQIPAYYVTGNHEDSNPENKEKIIQLVKDNNKVVSNNGVFELSGNIQLVNLNDTEASNPNNFPWTDKWTIAIIHRPEYALAGNKNYDLLICGHMHGGQWRLPFIREGLVTPDRRLFPKWTSGLYKINDKTKMIVTRGIGTATWVPRIFNNPEIVSIKIKKC